MASAVRFDDAALRLLNGQQPSQCQQDRMNAEVPSIRMIANRKPSPRHALLRLGTLLAVGCALPALPPASAAEGPGEPMRLRCEYGVSPLGLDVKAPRLSWQVDDPRRGAVQSAYQILVAIDPAALAYDQGTECDSGRVESDQSVHVVYAGWSVPGTGRAARRRTPSRPGGRWACSIRGSGPRGGSRRRISPVKRNGQSGPSACERRSRSKVK